MRIVFLLSFIGLFACGDDSAIDAGSDANPADMETADLGTADVGTADVNARHRRADLYAQ